MRHALLASSVLGILVAFAAWAQELPAGQGREVVQKVCFNCHEVREIVTPRKTADQWADTVDRMIRNGAKLSDADYDTVVDYLAMNFSSASSPPAPPSP